MAHKLEYAPEAVEYLGKMDKTQAKRIMNKLDWLAENADAYPHEAMTGNCRIFPN